MKNDSLPPVYESDSPPEELLAWEAFLSAKTAEERCRAWLAFVCNQIRGATAAAVLVENLDDYSYVPIAVWPAASQSLSRLGAVVETTLRDRRGIVQAVADDSGTAHFSYPLMVGQHIAGVVVVEAHCPESQFDDVMRSIHWGSAWLANLLSGRELDEAIRGKERVASVLDVTAVMLRHGTLQQALFDVANTLRCHFSCARVAIGFVDHAVVKLVALSDAATFEKQMPLVKAYVQAMEETHDMGKPMQSCSVADTSTPEVMPAPKHEALKAVSGAGAVLSFPLIMGATCVAVITLEREAASFSENDLSLQSEAETFSNEDLAWLTAFSALVAPIIEQRRNAERGLFPRLVKDGRDVLTKIFGPRHLTWKAATSLLLIVTLLLILVPVEYRVSAKMAIEGEVQRVAAAPFDGFVSAAYVRAGDSVKEGQILAQLEDRELRMEETRWSSERDQYQSRLQEAVANHDLTAMQILGAQLRQASAQLALITEKIERAQIKAPFDGVVVSGDLSQQIGAPVETGKKLFEVAPLQSYRVILQVDEREIRHVLMNQDGHMMVTGIAGDPMPFKIAKVTPVATAQDGKNFFRVEAGLAETSPRLRPGMEGIGKIEVGSKSLWWVLTHSFTDWLILQLWTWMP